MIMIFIFEYYAKNSCELKVVYRPVIQKDADICNNPYNTLLYMSRCERQDLRPTLHPQFRRNETYNSHISTLSNRSTRHHTTERLTIQPRSNRLPTLVHQHARIIIKLDSRAILPPYFFGSAYHNRVPYITAAHLVRSAHCRRSAATGRLGAKVSLFLDYDDDAVADAGGAFGAEDVDAFDDCGARVVDAGKESL